MAVTTNPTPEPQPTPTPRPTPPPQPAPASDPATPVTPPPPTPTQEELDAMATGDYDPLAPEGQRVKRRSMEAGSGSSRYPTR